MVIKLLLKYNSCFRYNRYLKILVKVIMTDCSDRLSRDEVTILQMQRTLLFFGDFFDCLTISQ